MKLRCSVEISAFGRLRRDCDLWAARPAAANGRGRRFGLLVVGGRRIGHDRLRELDLDRRRRHVLGTVRLMVAIGMAVAVPALTVVEGADARAVFIVPVAVGFAVAVLAVIAFQLGAVAVELRLGLRTIAGILLMVLPVAATAVPAAPVILALIIPAAIILASVLLAPVPAGL